MQQYIILVIMGYQPTRGAYADCIVWWSLYLDSTYKEHTSWPQIATAQILWLQHPWEDTEEQGLGSSCFVCRAVTKMGDNFYPVKDWSQNSNDGQLLSCRVIFSPEDKHEMNQVFHAPPNGL